MSGANHWLDEVEANHSAYENRLPDEIVRLQVRNKDLAIMLKRLLVNHTDLVNYAFPGGLPPLPLPDEEDTLDLRLEVIDLLDRAES